MIADSSTAALTAAHLLISVKNFKVDSTQMILWPYLTLEEVARASIVSVAWQSVFGDKNVRTLTLRWNGMSCPVARPLIWASALRVRDIQSALLAQHCGSQKPSISGGSSDFGSPAGNSSPDSNEASYDESPRNVAVTQQLAVAASKYYAAAKRSRCAKSENSVDSSNAVATTVVGSRNSSNQEVHNTQSPRYFIGSWGEQNDEIMRDVGRTFPRVPFFADAHDENLSTNSGTGQRMLANVLRAAAAVDPVVGYCQGMNFVVGSLLRAVITSKHGRKERGSGNVPEWSRNDGGGCTEAKMRAAEQSFAEKYHEGTSTSEAAAAAAEEAIEAEAFWLLVAMMGTFEHRQNNREVNGGSHSSSNSINPKSRHNKRNELQMRSLWRCGVASSVKLRAYQFDRLLKEHLPKLHAHFDAIGLAPEILVSQWLMTLFAYALPLPHLLRVWDLVLVEGWKALFKVAIAKLQLAESDLLPLNLEATSKYLRAPRDRAEDEDEAAIIAEIAAAAAAAVDAAQSSVGDDTESPQSAETHEFSSPPRSPVSPRDRAENISDDGVVALMAAAAQVKVTRSALARLEADFEVELVREKLGGEHHDGGWLTRYDSMDPTSTSTSSPTSPTPTSSSSSLASAAASSAAAATSAFLSMSEKLSRSHSSNSNNDSGLSSHGSSKQDLSLSPAAQHTGTNHRSSKASSETAASATLTSSARLEEPAFQQPIDPLESLRADLSSLDAINRTDAAHFQRKIEHTENLLASSSQALDTASKWEATCAKEVHTCKQAHQDCMQRVQRAHLNLRRNSHSDGSASPNSGRSSNGNAAGVAPSNAQRIWLNRVTREVEQLKIKPPNGVELLLEEGEDGREQLQHRGAAELNTTSSCAEGKGGLDPVRCTCTVKLRCSYTIPSPSSRSKKALNENAAASDGASSQSTRSFVLSLDLSKAARYPFEPPPASVVEGAGWFPTGAFFDDLLPNRSRPTTSNASSSSSSEHRALLLVPPFDHDHMWTPSDGCGTFVDAVLDRLRATTQDGSNENDGGTNTRNGKWPPPPMPRNDALQEMMLISSDTAASGAAASGGDGGHSNISTNTTNQSNATRFSVWKQLERSWLQAPSTVEGLLFGSDLSGSSNSTSNVSSSNGVRNRSSSHPLMPPQPPSSPPSTSSSSSTGSDTLWRAWHDIGGALSNSSSGAFASGGPLGRLPWTKTEGGGNGASTDNRFKLQAELREAQSAVVAASQRLAKAEVVHETAVAKRIECLADVEDAHEAKRSLCRQLTHVLQAHEETKYSRMLSGSASVLLGAADEDGK